MGWKILTAAAFLALALFAAKMRDQAIDAQIDAANAAALLDTTRLLYQDSLGKVSERLAIQERGAIQLQGERDRLLRANQAQVSLYARLRVALDSIEGAVTRGVVTGDSAVRTLSASLDSAGFHVGVRASVPAPPDSATVQWTVRRDPVEIAAALSRTEDGRAALRVHAGPNSEARIDSIITTATRNARTTQKVAGVGLILLLGYALGRIF